MEAEKEKAAVTGRPSQSVGDNALNQRSNFSKPPSKIHRVLDALSRRSYNTLEAHRELHDTCLHSTVAAIERRFGFRVDRVREKVPGYRGMATWVKRYRISADQRERAQQVIRDLQAGRRRASD